MSRKVPASAAWNLHDTALWYTCEIAADLVAGRLPHSKPEVLAAFPPQPPDELFWASGQFQLLELRTLGDGSYVHNGGFFFATGPLGLAATAATAIGRAAGNGARRKAAAQAAVPRWTVIDTGWAYIAPSGFAMQSQGGVFHWSGGSIQAAQMVAPRTLHFYGNSSRGPISWILVSDWAELIFLTWALRHHPRHPQLLDGGWLPPGWLTRCAGYSHGTRLPRPELSRSP